MTIALLLAMTLFIIIIQAAIPFLLKSTVVFGVTVPNGDTKNEKLLFYKKMYASIILASGAVTVTAFMTWFTRTSPIEDKLLIVGIAIQFAILLLSMALYFVFHAKTTKLKTENQWGAKLKQVRLVDLAARTADEMLPFTFFLLPMVITIGLIIYTTIQYPQLPELIPTHWGIDGQPDAFTEKTPFSAIALLLILLIMQGMMAGINEFTKRSGIKIQANRKKKSRAQQLAFRKYSSWLLFATVLLLTILFAFLQLMTIHEHIGGTAIALALPIAFIIIIFGMTAVYAFKVGQGGARLDVQITDEEVEGITNYDDDQHWKLGVIYVNKDDPSIFVEKRFGVGWTVNFGNPIGYLIIFGPLLLIVGISLYL
ncbi:DUF1648 domain-containing protein [Sporosarcina pasteurii]|uniref:Predicted membrane protein n=1 Tax=Sporosarcina pasteurii TaxID=1474 RepID=A0A380C3S6_SPOPA|nr:DUF5808 domain-containing protein [Sporosarcina pasteurii]MDS9471702.1 DUF5808 domain-containing protein [Sporosarcina pasteurii]QBQ04697.1 DUF1648 domain-containing protein [Sporosarcina pasteurii]SUJ12205.1 Predicted membrane protein [Sporosarcina pasteurii]